MIGPAMIRAAMIRAAAALRRDHRGASLVEFALVAHLILLPLAGTFDLGALFLTQRGLTWGVEAAARYASVNSTTATTAAITARFAAAAGPSMGAAATAATTVSIAYAPADAVGGSVTVTASYPWSGVLALGGIAPRTLTASQTLIIQH
ncbi:hypothetical protein Asru_0131_03 [Acidisphaera rubrifaciens HS-AP3]|uniref:TadE-like domain-containing protein n=2 Tax=Acidisphaera TaxID=50714 RepID=A0A0D6P5L4_9PROT|nr:hypothetical protein Asru_0131_03 [Acidisphaera rubrifaciens HS-AP3]